MKVIMSKIFKMILKNNNTFKKRKKVKNQIQRVKKRIRNQHKNIWKYFYKLVN